MEPLAHALDIALTRAVELATDLDDASWQTTSPLPNWTVGDIIAHLAHLQGLANDFPQPEPPADAEEHPHPLHRFTGMGVAARRGRSRSEVVAELRAAAEATRQRLGNVSGDDWDQPAMTAAGPGTLRVATQMRVGDVYVHLLDLAHALDMDPGHVRHPAPEEVIVRRAIDLVGWAMVKRAHLEEGTVIFLDLSGPGAGRSTWAVTEGRGRRVEDERSPDGTISGPGIAFVLRAGGRRWPPVLTDLSVDGEAAERLLGSFGLFG